MTDCVWYEGPLLNVGKLVTAAEEMALVRCDGNEWDDRIDVEMQLAVDELVAKSGARVDWPRYRIWFPDEEHLVMFKMRWM